MLHERWFVAWYRTINKIFRKGREKISPNFSLKKKNYNAHESERAKESGRGSEEMEKEEFFSAKENEEENAKLLFNKGNKNFLILLNLITLLFSLTLLFHIHTLLLPFAFFYIQPLVDKCYGRKIKKKKKSEKTLFTQSFS